LLHSFIFEISHLTMPHKRATHLQPEKKNGRKHRPAVLSEQAGEPAGQADLHGKETLEAQAAQLEAGRWQMAQRLAIVGQIGQRQGNMHLQRMMEKATPDRREPQSGVTQLQRDHQQGRRGSSGGPTGPGRMRNSEERYYDVTGKTLAEVSTQLTQIDGYASETYTGLTIEGRVRPQRRADGTYQVRVKWVIRGTYTRLPRWIDYNKGSAAAKAEWNRFMTQTRLHEQQAHVDAAQKFVEGLGEEDTVITGASVEEVSQNLQAKQQELGSRLQAIHDSCTHGTDVDAILHPE
jgi:predicted secreted Zn-dependent protease